MPKLEWLCREYTFVPMCELAEKIGLRTGLNGQTRWDSAKPDGRPRRGLEVSRAKERFGFAGEMASGEGLKGTIEWWRSQGGGEELGQGVASRID